jgi:D-hydroxyproline dehydrogenase subunit gamma
MNKTDSDSPSPLFRQVHDITPQVRVELDGKLALASADETVAALLLRLASVESYRISPISGAPRAPLCMMGVCFECLVEVDGQTNQQGCMVRVSEGMHIRRQNGAKA